MKLFIRLKSIFKLKRKPGGAGAQLHELRDSGLTVETIKLPSGAIIVLVRDTREQRE